MNHWEKKAKQLLLHPEGRAVLKRYGIDVEIAKNEKELAEKPIIVALVPTYRVPEPQMQDSLSAMVRYTREKDFATIYSGPPLGSSVVHWTRNGLIQEHLKSGKPWTHVLFIDDDIVVEPDALERLLSHGKDIVAGLCTRRQDPPVPNIRLYDEESGKYQQIWEWPEGELIGDHKRLAVGTGLMLISKNALEQVAQAYFDCVWEQEKWGLTGEKLEKEKALRLDAFDKDKTCYWFRFLENPKVPIEMGEDISFCFMATRYCDIPVYVDTKVQPGHIGNYPFSIRDFLPHRDECVLRAKVNGHYPMPESHEKISLLCPTRGRPQMVRNLLNSLVATSTELPQVVLYVDDDDLETTGASINGAGLYPIDKLLMIRGSRILMTEMWNRCAEQASGEIMLLTGDDVLFKTKGWDDQVKRAFAAFPDRLVLVHGDDGIHGNRFATHCFLHRAWVDAVGYFSPPYFSSDYGDTWINDVFNAVNRRVFLPIETEHLHPLAGKGEWDQTHKDRLERHQRDDVTHKYQDLLPERIADIRKVKERLGIPWEAAKTTQEGRSLTAV